MKPKQEKREKREAGDNAWVRFIGFRLWLTSLISVCLIDRGIHTLLFSDLFREWCHDQL